MTGPWRRKEVIGDCTLYLGDCLQVMPTLAPVDAVVTDPPYEAHMHKAKVRTRRGLRTDGLKELQALDFASIDAIRADVVAEAARVSAGWVIAFCTPEGIGRWADAINASTMKYKRACIWVKPDATPQLNGQCPAQGAECFVCAWAGTGYSRWNGGGKRGIYTHCTNQPTREGTHPTEKPVPLMAELLNDFTQPGDTVLDPFMGSGTTGVACIKTGRTFVGIELNEAYFDLACRRIEKAYAQGDLFLSPTPAHPQQDDMLEGAE